MATSRWRARSEKARPFVSICLAVADPVRGQLVPSAEPVVLTADSPRSSVLIVEDEEAVRYLSRVILERAGHRVYEASTPEQAESVMSEVGQVDVLVADVMLPGGRGPDLFARLRVRYPALRVVFMSGYLDEDVLEGAETDPAMRFIQKPFAADALLGSVSRLLDAAGRAGDRLSGNPDRANRRGVFERGRKSGRCSRPYQCWAITPARPLDETSFGLNRTNLWLVVVALALAVQPARAQMILVGEWSPALSRGSAGAHPGTRARRLHRAAASPTARGSRPTAGTPRA